MTAARKAVAMVEQTAGKRAAEWAARTVWTTVVEWEQMSAAHWVVQWEAWSAESRVDESAELKGDHWAVCLAATSAVGMAVSWVAKTVVDLVD